jgi:uncharacterized RDD family membrane protein YckC
MMPYADTSICADCKPAFLQRLREGAATRKALPYASPWIRVVALMLDGVILLIAELALQHFLGVRFSTTPAAAFSLATPSGIASLCLGFAYYVILLTKYGATLGKMAMGLKVVTSEGGRISFGRAAARYFCAGFLELFTLWIGDLIAFFDDQRRTLHDRICGTRVIAVS